MRSVTLTVGGIPIGEGVTWAYPKGIDLGRFLIPIYRLTVSGTACTGVPVTKIFQVFRFGVQSEDGKTARVVGLAEEQTHTIQGWIPDYSVHSREDCQAMVSSPECPDHGAWRVMKGKGFLVHAGPPNPFDRIRPCATIGCIEVIGINEFIHLINLLIDLMGPPAGSATQKLTAIGNSGQLFIAYQSAPRPTLKVTR